MPEENLIPSIHLPIGTLMNIMTSQTYTLPQPQTERSTQISDSPTPTKLLQPSSVCYPHPSCISKPIYLATPYSFQLKISLLNPSLSLRVASPFPTSPNGTSLSLHHLPTGNGTEWTQTSLPDKKIPLSPYQSFLEHLNN